MCSLQEAYSYPSFDSVNSKKQLGCTGQVTFENSVPVSNGSNKRQVGEYQKYNEFGADRGKEYVSFVDAWNTYGNQKENFQDYSAQLAHTTDKVALKSIYNDMDLNKKEEEARNNRGRKNATIEGPAYKGQANDVQYYCNNYQICPDVLPENFTNPVPKSQCIGPVEQKYNIPSINPSKDSQNYMNGMNAYTNQDSMMKQYIGTPTPDVRCSNPSQIYDAMYRSKDFDKGMNTALNQQTSCAGPYKVPMRKIDMNNVKGYVEDGMDDYINLDEMNKTIPITRSMNNRNAPADFKDENGTIFKTNMEQFSNPNNNYSYNSYNSNDNMQYILDIVLFILAGILIIFLCDQIYRIAALSGMKETLAMLKDLKD